MENVVNESIKYMLDVGYQGYEMYFEAGVTELLIPETNKGIKNFVMRKNNLLYQVNQRVRLIAMPLAKVTINNGENDYISKLYDDYFLLEKECLIAIKKALQNRKKFDYGLPFYSSCGILVDAIGNIHNENQEKLTNIVNLISDASYRGFDVSISKEKLVPTNAHLIKRITTTLNGKLNNKNKKE